MGATCGGSCYSKNEYDVDMEVLLANQKQAGLTKDDLNLTVGDLNNSFRIAPQQRENMLRETVGFQKIYNKDFEKTHSTSVLKLQNAFKKFSAQRLVKTLLKEKRASQAAMKYFRQDEAKQTIGMGKPLKLNCMPMMKPKFTYKTGAIYSGEWLGGFRHGFGTMTWKDGAIYAGEWQFGEPTNKGKFKYPNGDIYEGKWSMNQMNGFGVFKYKNGTVYKGNWCCSQQHGLGCETWEDGTSYLGDYQNGKKEGAGIFFWKEGTKYTGQWVDDKLQGFGTHQWTDGRTFVGQWDNGLMQGIGIYKWEDGRVFEGEFNKDQKQGFGVHKWADGRVYKGGWKEGKQDGLGTYTYINEDRKEITMYGLWSNGERLKWFPVDQNQLVETQLRAIEEAIQKQNPMNKLTFNAPPKFYEKLALAVTQCQNLQNQMSKVKI